MSDRGAAPAPKLERALLAELERGADERFTLPEVGVCAIARALEQVLEGPSAAAELRRLLQLVVALETELASRTAAARLRALITAEPRALQVIERHVLKTGAIDETRRFLRSEGREVVVAASPGARRGAPRGPRVADFLDPAGAVGRVPRVVNKG